MRSSRFKISMALIQEVLFTLMKFSQELKSMSNLSLLHISCLHELSLVERVLENFLTIIRLSCNNLTSQRLPPNGDNPLSISLKQ
jgi:hypothetical protein